MRLPPVQPQTLHSVFGYYVWSMALFGIVGVVLSQIRGHSPDAIQYVLTGTSFGTMMIAFDYFRLATKDRLAPVHAIGLGLLNVALVIWVLATRKSPITREWIIWAPAVIIALPPMALVVAGARQWRREAALNQRSADG